MESKDSFWLKIIYIVSAVVCIAVAFLILGPRPEGIEVYNVDVSSLPMVNVLLNSITTILLLVGLIDNKFFISYIAVFELLILIK